MKSAVRFVIGLATGALLTIAGFAIGASEGDLDRLRETALYAISALAVDTEKNAQKIVALEQRADDLEARLAELTCRAR